MKNFLEKHNADFRKAATKYKHTVETFSKELGKQLFKSMDAQELQDIKNYFQFELKSGWHCKQDQKHKIIDD